MIPPILATADRQAPPLAAAPVERHPLQRREIDPLETTHIHRRRRRARGAFAEPERRAAAVRAEMVLDHVFVERVGRHLGVGRIETQLLPRHEPEQGALALADADMSRPSQRRRAGKVDGNDLIRLIAGSQKTPSEFLKTRDVLRQSSPR